MSDKTENIKENLTDNRNYMLDTIRGYYKEDELSVKTLIQNSLNWEQRVYSIMMRDPRYNCKKMFDYTRTSGKDVEYEMALNFKTTMRELLCTKVDRAAMTVSLESREPMLDHRIAEFAAQLPLDYKYKDGVKKCILKDLVYDYQKSMVLSSSISSMK